MLHHQPDWYHLPASLKKITFGHVTVFPRPDLPVLPEAPTDLVGRPLHLKTVLRLSSHRYKRSTDHVEMAGEM
jgi:hypothetical protein